MLWSGTSRHHSLRSRNAFFRWPSWMAPGASSAASTSAAHASYRYGRRMRCAGEVGVYACRRTHNGLTSKP